MRAALLLWSAVVTQSLVGSAAAQVAAGPPADVPAGALQSVEIEDRAARQLFEVATMHYQQGRFTDAAQEYEQAYRLSNRPGLLYNAFLGYRDAGERRDALRVLRAYLAAVPDRPDRTVLEARAATLEREVAESERVAAAEPTPTPPPTPDEPPASVPPPIAAPHPSDRARAEPSRVLPIVLFGVGGALVAAAVVTGIVTLGQHADLADACPSGTCAPSLQGDIDSMQSFALATDILAVTGIAAASAGLVLWLTARAGPESSESVHTSFGCGPAGCGAFVRWRL